MGDYLGALHYTLTTLLRLDISLVLPSTLVPCVALPPIALLSSGHFALVPAVSNSPTAVVLPTLGALGRG